MLNIKGTVKIDKTNLKKIREEKGLTQVQIAEKANITERSYQRYESGERIPNVYTAQLIADALNVRNIKEIFPLPQLQSEKGEPQSDSNPAERNNL